ncbi:MAG: hypothetical protein ABIQ18_21580 [Umezawaea sp.]
MSIKVWEYAVTLRRDKELSTTHTLAHGSEEAALLVFHAEGAWSDDAVIEWIKVRPICDYCDGLATLVERGTLTPLCKRHAKEHYGSEWRAMTRELGVRYFLDVSEVER